MLQDEDHQWMIMDALQWIVKGDLDLMSMAGILRTTRGGLRLLTIMDVSQQIIRDNLGHTLRKDPLNKVIRNQDEGRHQVHRAQVMDRLSKMDMEILGMMTEEVMVKVRLRQ
jgi:hypothetical protein